MDWRRTAFMLIAPDAIARHLAIPMLHRLHAAGFAPLGFRQHWLRPAGVDEFHERNIATAWDAYLYRLVDLLFSYGPMVALLVRDERPGDLGTHQRLRRLKGRSDPAKDAEGTIRHDLGAINVMLGLLHSADSPEASERESRVFLGDDLGAPGALHDGADLEPACHLLQAALPREWREFDDVLGGVRARITAAAWADLTPAARRLAAGLAGRGCRALAQTGAGAALADGLLPAGRHPLAPLLACEFTPDHAPVDLHSGQHQLAVFGVHLDRWEELVLTTSMRFHPRRSAAAAGSAPPAAAAGDGGLAGSDAAVRLLAGGDGRGKAGIER